MSYFMYVSISQEDKVLRFTVDQTTGKLELQGEVAVPGPAGANGGQSRPALPVRGAPGRPGSFQLPD